MTTVVELEQPDDIPDIDVLLKTLKDTQKFLCKQVQELRKENKSMKKLQTSEIAKLKKAHLLECQQLEKRFKLTRTATRVQNKSGVNKPQPVPKQIGKLLQINEEISQNGLKTKLFEYATANNLHPIGVNGKPSRREIVPDKALQNIFGIPDGQNMEFKDVSVKITELYKTKEPVHKAIAKVLNLTGELSRYGVKKALLEYADQQELYDVDDDGKKNKRAIKPNKELKKLFGISNDQLLMTSSISKKIDDLYSTKEYLAMIHKMNNKKGGMHTDDSSDDDGSDNDGSDDGGSDGGGSDDGGSDDGSEDDGSDDDGSDNDGSDNDGSDNDGSEDDGSDNDGTDASITKKLPQSSKKQKAKK